MTSAASVVRAGRRRQPLAGQGDPVHQLLPHDHAAADAVGQHDPHQPPAQTLPGAPALGPLRYQPPARSARGRPAAPPAGGLQDGPATSLWPQELVEKLTRLREEAVTALRLAGAHPAFDEARTAGQYPKFLTALHKRITEAEAEAA
ncbi:hypothetical protein [Kitasatospora purpeofusca]|uniref:hypothetical protein n=1 Tax=Kitasatospora purpeofusca TaxID=67352 RepID=UPI0036547308